MPRKTVRKRPAAPLVQEQPGNLIRLSTETRENIKLEKTLESLPTSCTIQIVCTPNADPETVEIKAEDIHHRTLDNAKLGQGQFGIVEKLTVRSSNGNSKIIACKRIPIQSGLHNFYQNKSCLQDKEVAKKSKNCRYTVDFYDCLYYNSSIWILMEVMDTSLDKFYMANIGSTNPQAITENFLKRLIESTLEGLSYLRSIQVIHRDIKPSNILLNKNGQIKLCDFGVAGELCNSIAKTGMVGCQLYFAPEKFDIRTENGYGVETDVWSMGISLVEVINGRFPYRDTPNQFDLLVAIKDNPSPQIDADKLDSYSQHLINFVNACLTKEPTKRPKYDKLKSMEFYQEIQNVDESSLQIFIETVFGNLS